MYLSILSKATKGVFVLFLFFNVQNGYSQNLPLSNFGVAWQDSIEWKSFASFPAKVKLAIMVGEPAKPLPFVVRVKVPAGEKILPHKHPETRIYTVMSGVFYIGLGETYKEENLKAYPPGSVIVLPGNTAHFHWAKSGEYITQVFAIGPL